MAKTNYEKLRERYLARQQQLADQDRRWWKPEVGQKYRIRILPPPEGHDLWFLEYGVHYVRDAEIGPITCAKLTLSKRCFACDTTNALWRGDQNAKALARSLTARRRYVSNILVLSGQNPNEVRLWAYGSTVWDQLSELCVGSEGAVPIDDPKTGYCLTLTVKSRRTEMGVFPQYVVTPDLKPSALPNPGVLQELHNFVQIITERVKPFEEIRALLGGHSDPPPPATAEAEEAEPPSSEEIVEDEVEEPPPTTVPAPKLPSRKRQVDDETEEIHGTPQIVPSKTATAANGEDLVARARRALAARRGSS